MFFKLDFAHDLLFPMWKKCFTEKLSGELMNYQYGNPNASFSMITFTNTLNKNVVQAKGISSSDFLG
jgi:hypothetical protein